MGGGGGGGLGASSGFKPLCYKLLHMLSRDSSGQNTFQAVLTIDKQL